MHGLSLLYTSKGINFKGVKLLNFTKLVSNLKFTSSLFIHQAKLNSCKLFLSLNLMIKFIGNVKK